MEDFKVKITEKMEESDTKVRTEKNSNSTFTIKDTTLSKVYIDQFYFDNVVGTLNLKSELFLVVCIFFFIT